MYRVKGKVELALWTNVKIQTNPTFEVCQEIILRMYKTKKKKITEKVAEKAPLHQFVLHTV